MIDEEFNLFNRLNDKQITECIEDIKKKGYSIIRGYLKKEHIQDVQSKIDFIHNFLIGNGYKSLESSLPLSYLKSKEISVLLINHIPIYQKLFLEMSVKGSHLKILTELLNDKFYGLIPVELPNFILSEMNARKTYKPLPWHNDVRYQTKQLETYSCQCFMSLENVNSTNGTLSVIPNSHLLGCYPTDVNENQIENLELDAGDFVIFDSRIYHATSNLITAQSPWTIVSQYRSWWVKPLFNYWRFFMSSPKSISGLNPIERSILGENSEPPYDPMESNSARKGLNLNYG